MNSIFNKNYYFLIYPIIGFGILTFASLIDAHFHVADYLFTINSKYKHFFLDFFLDLLVGIPVLYYMKKQADKLIYLEEFVRLCGWCQKINIDGNWIDFTSFTLQNYRQPTHGICPDCAKTLMNKLEGL